MKDTIRRIFSVKNIIALVLLILCLVLLLCFCTRRRAYITAEGVAFGTIYHITYAATAEEDSAIGAALEAIDRSLSLFNPESTLARLNRGDTVAVDSLFLTVYNRGMEVSRATGGCFDMTVAPLVNLWGFGPEERRQNYDSLAAIADSLSQTIGYERISLTVRDGRMWLEGGSVDAAAIAKGFAADVVGRALRARGVEDYCVEIGGEIAVRGHNPEGHKWRIGINHPEADSAGFVSKADDIVELTDAGMATSGNYRNFYRMGQRQIVHTIDPRTARPIQSDILSATIIAADCVTADAFATASMVAGLDEAVSLVRQHNELSAYFIHGDEHALYITSVVNGRVTRKQLKDE